MENLTKALLIVGGMLIVIMVLTLVITVVNQISAYYKAQHYSTMVEQVTEFNSKFDNYSGQIIRGNELLSIINKVIDYNNCYADMEGYEEIIFSANLKKRGEDLKYNGNSSISFDGIPDRINNDNMKDISEATLKIIGDLNNELKYEWTVNETILQRLSAEVSNLENLNGRYESSERINAHNEYRIYRIRKVFSLSDNIKDDEITKHMVAIQSAAYDYYQIMKFKSALFKCIGVSHNHENGRVNGISFEVVIENGNIKFK